MHDAVAEVLEQRQAVTQSKASGIVGSLILHLLLAATIAFSFRHSEAQELTQVLNVRLAPVAPRLAPMQELAASPPVAEPKPPSTEEFKPVIKEPAPKPQEPPIKAQAEPSVFGKSNEKAAEPSPTAPVPPAAAEGETPVEKFPVPAIGSAGVTGLEGEDFPFTIYIDRMITLVGNRWFRPQSWMLVQVHFVIERDGTIRDPKIEKSSGNSKFDRDAIRAVMEASPLPPLPFAYAGNDLGVHLTFR